MNDVQENNIAKRTAFVIFVVALVLLALYSLGAADALLRVKNTIYEAEGMFFYGELGDGRFKGSGKIIFPNGDTYEGDIKGGRFNGYGVYVSSSGWQYEGWFSDGIPSE